MLTQYLLKLKKSSEVRDAFVELFLSIKPKKLWTDDGSEFYNEDLKTSLKMKTLNYITFITKVKLVLLKDLTEHLVK